MPNHAISAALGAVAGAGLVASISAASAITVRWHENVEVRAPCPNVSAICARVETQASAPGGSCEAQHIKRIVIEPTPTPGECLYSAEFSKPVSATP